MDYDHEQAMETYGQFLREALRPYCVIEGSEIGEAQERLCNAIDSDLGTAFIKVAEALDDSIREMIASEWFQELAEEEVPPHDYYNQGLTEAREAVEKIRHDHIGQAKRYGGKYGGTEAEELIKAWVAP